MSLTRIRATGRGRISARLVIEGLEYVFVSSKRMERTMSDGRVCVEGLDLSDMTIGASADIMRARLEGTGLTVRINDLDRLAGKRHGRVTRALWRSETVRCFLATNVLYNDTSIVLRDATALPASGVVHIATEAIAYSSRTSTTLTVAASGRGYWGTVAQGHFVADGEGLNDALVTDQPIGIEGRRCVLYLYGDGDDPQGDGTARWRGVCATDARWSGGRCEFDCDPITRLLDQPIGGDLSSPVKIRGIHYTSASPWGMEVVSLGSGTSAIANVRVVGFFETQAAFITAANAAIATETVAAGILSGGDGTLYLDEDVSGYRVVYKADSTTPETLFARVISDIDATYLAGPGAVGTFEPIGWDGVYYGDRSWVPTAGASYSYAMVARVPRATMGRRLAWSESTSVPAGLDADYLRLYLGGLVTPTVNDAIVFGGGELWVASVYAVDAPTRRVTTATGTPDFIRLGETSELALGRNLAVGNFLDVVSYMNVFSPRLANSGAMPIFDGNDVTWDADSGSDVADTVAATRLANGRGFYLFEGGVTLGEILVPEMLACGIYMRLRTSGVMEFIRIRPPLVTDEATIAIDDSAGFDQQIERSPRGVLAQVVYRFGYDPREDEWDDRTLTFRDVQSVSATRNAITLEIAQRSTDRGYYVGTGAGIEGIDRVEVGRIAQAHLGMFGMPTAVVTLSTDARYMDARIGDTVSLSSSILPDIEDGCSAVTSRSGIIVAHSLEIASGRMSLGILMHTQRFAGYVPAFLVASQIDNGSNEWDVTVTLSPYTESADVADWLTAGDLVRVSNPADITDDVTGTVVSIVDADTVRVQFGATWTPGADEWCLRAQIVAAQTAGTGLGRYCYVAGSDRRLNYSGANADAQVFA